MKHRTVKDELARMELLRATSFKIAYAFALLTEHLPRTQRNALFSTLSRRMERCASSLYIGIARPKGNDPYVKVSNRNSCNSRHCPPCARRIAYKQRQLMGALLDIMYARHARDGLYGKFLTVSLRNVPMPDCASMLAHLTSSVRKLLEDPRVQLAHRGAWVQFECPIRGTEAAPEAGWHAHALLMCDEASLYLHFEEWRRIFRACAAVSYDPIVRIEPVTARDTDSPHEAAARATFECAKYLCAPLSLMVQDKATDLFDVAADMPMVVNPEALRWLALTVHKKRLHRCNGVWANALLRHRKGWHTPPNFGDDNAPSNPPF